MDFQTIYESYQKDTEQQNPIVLRSLLPRRGAPKIIGPHGKYIQPLQSRSNVIIRISKYERTNGFGRLVQVKAYPRDIPSIFGRFLTHLALDRPEDVKLMYMDFILPHVIIEEFSKPRYNGKTIFDRIAHESNTQLTIKYFPLPRSTERIVRISIPDTGDDHEACFEQALELLIHHLKDNITLYLSFPENIFYTQGEDDTFIENHIHIIEQGDVVLNPI